jgi:type I restriction enzyme R subunit
MHKTHFVVVDAVGVTETMKVDSRPLDRKPNVSFDKLLDSIALGRRDSDTVNSLAARLAMLDREIDDNERKEIEDAASGRSLKQIINTLLDAVDPDKHEEKAKQLFKTEEPTENELREAKKQLIDAACNVLDDPKLRLTIKDVKKRSEQIIDIVSEDVVTRSSWDPQAKEKAESLIKSFEGFIEDNKDEITALQIIYAKPYGSRQLTFDEIEELAKAIQKPPYKLRADLLWEAYEKLDKSRVRGAGAHVLLTDVISLVRFAIGEQDVLEPFASSVNARFDEWILKEKQRGHEYSWEQMQWLMMIRDHIAASACIEPDDFENVPFEQKGGRFKASEVLGQNFEGLLGELNKALVH